MRRRLWIDVSLAGLGRSGLEALQLRHALERELEDSGLGEVLGGGCEVDGSAFDFEVEVTDADRAEALVRFMLDREGLADRSRVRRMD